MNLAAVIFAALVFVFMFFLVPQYRVTLSPTDSVPCAPPIPALCSAECLDMLKIILDQRKKSYWIRYYSDITTLLSYHNLNSSVFVEIGTAYGGLSATLLRSLPNLLIMAVDPFLGAYDNSDAMSLFYDRFKESRANFSNLWSQALIYDNSVRYCGRYTLFHTTSNKAAQTFKAGSVDIVFIDGDHTKVGVEKDIIAWRLPLKIGGFFLFNDYSVSFPGVVEAVDSFAVQTNQTVWPVEPKDHGNVGLLNLG